MDRGRTAELRDGDALDLLGTAFDEIARNVDVRRITSAHTRGTANIPEVGVFVWRLRAYTVTEAPAYCYEEEAPNCFLFARSATTRNCSSTRKRPAPIRRCRCRSPAALSRPGKPTRQPAPPLRACRFITVPTRG